MVSVSTDRRYGVNSGLAIKAPCVAATTASISLSGEQTVDGVACVTGDRVLVKNQSSGIENGIYVVDTGSWTRALDFDGSLDVVKGTIVTASGGSVNANTLWRVSTSSPVVGTSSIAFVENMASSTSSSAISFYGAGTGATARTAQDKLREVVSVLDFGADLTGVADSSAAFQAAITYLQTKAGGTVFVPQGSYTLDSSVTLDRSADYTKGRVSILGADQYGTQITFTPASGSAFVIKNSHSLVGVEANASYQCIENLTLIGPSATGSSIGIEVNLAAFLDMRDLYITNFGYGIYAQDIDHALFMRVQSKFNKFGFFAQKHGTPGAASTQPNNLQFVGCVLSQNGSYGGYILGGSALTFVGGSVENNGVTVGASGFGLKIEDSGYEGAGGANFTGVYFESNNGVADLVLEDLPVIATNVAHSLVGCTFSRATSSHYATNNIAVNFGSVATYGTKKLTISGCGFQSSGTYSADAGRPYIQWYGVAATKDNFYQLGCIFEDAVEKPTGLQNLQYQFCEVSQTAAQSISNTTWTKWLIDGILYSFSWTPVLTTNDIEIPENGVYAINVTATWSSAAAGARGIRLKTGANIFAQNMDTTVDVISTTTTKRLAAGDIISVEVYQATGGAININGSGTSYSFINITKLAD